MKNPFWNLAARLYGEFKPSVSQKQNPKIKKELKQLYPSKNAERLYDNYQIRKLAAVSAVFITGIVSAILLHLCSRLEGSLAEGAQLIRKEWGAGNYQVMLKAATEEWSRVIPFLVKEQALSEEEMKMLLEELWQELPEIIKKENQDLQHVTGDLNLPSSVAGYPFQLSFKSGGSKRIDSRGRVDCTGLSEKGEQVALTVTAAYGEQSYSFTYEVTLLPEMLDDEERFFDLLSEELQAADAKKENSEIIRLPQSLQGKQITWEEVKTDHSLVFLLLVSVLGCVLVCRGMDNDLKRNCDKRKKQLLADYSGFVGKLRLYLSAGLTVKNAFVKMAADYKNEQNRKGVHYLYEEMKTACFQLENGMMEEQVYQDFGKRCGEMRYRRLSFLLSVHLKQGNQQLLMLLEREADSALEERRSMARKAGEEAGTKLLVPMMLMLVVVMFLILLPAWFHFGSI